QVRAHLALQFAFYQRRESRRYDFISHSECDLAPRCKRQFPRHCGIDLITDSDDAEFPLVIFAACHNRSKKDAVELAFAVPPGGIFSLFDGFLQIRFGKTCLPAGLGHMKTENLPVDSKVRKAG